jgi:hypothetical protein
MSTQKLIAGLFMVLCAVTSFAQAPPEKKTELTLADREAWQKILHWPDDMEEQWRRSRTTNDRDQSGLAFYSLGPGRYLVAIEVQESAYQPRYLFMHYTESPHAGKQARLLKLKTYERDDDAAGTISTKVLTEVEGKVTFDDTKKQLVLYTMGRGTADCGSLVRYNVTPTRVVPVEARVHACYDDYSLGITNPQKWRRLKQL